MIITEIGTKRRVFRLTINGLRVGRRCAEMDEIVGADPGYDHFAVVGDDGMRVTSDDQGAEAKFVSDV